MKKLACLLLFILSANSWSQAQNRVAKDVSVKEFAKLIETGKGTLLDVRTPGEIAKGSIKGSVNLDFFDDNFETKLEQLDKKKPVYVYCASGGRSSDAMEMMKKKGFVEVYNLSGGYNAWNKTYGK
ncbi:MAG: rhodanese-like domain-containing protein [Bacteroidota bacterium]|jgi:rhodanese-related sulfurtransferase